MLNAFFHDEQLNRELDASASSQSRGKYILERTKLGLSHHRHRDDPVWIIGKFWYNRLTQQINSVVTILGL